MYKVTCVGNPLLDFRDDELILINPKVKVEVNTVGEGSFKIYKSHPNFNTLNDPKSIFEFSDEFGVFFRGRMTEDSRDFDNGKAVDLEGIMSFFNDSIVRPFSFPEDFEKNSEYISASKSGNVVKYFLKWLIDNHNSQVEPFQRFKLGIVTVSDPNNYLSRSDAEYLKTWEALKSKLFDSSLGGFLCIRYEDDGNYIDYLSEFTETNTQGIEYGKNLLDLSHDTSRVETYSAIIPIGAKIADGDDERLTISGVENRNITDDIVKSGDTLYSKRAVAQYGWKYAPVSETTWDDVTNEENLLNNGLGFLTGTAIKEKETVEYSAADLHYSDSEIRSFRIYKKVNVDSAPHGLGGSYNLTKLDIDILNPQNNKITTGETRRTLTSFNGIYQDIIRDIMSSYATNKRLENAVLKTEAKIEKTDEEIRLFVSGEYAKKEYVDGELSLKIGKDENDKIVSMLNAAADIIRLKANRLVISSDHFQLSADGTVTAKAGHIAGFAITENGLLYDTIRIGLDGVGFGVRPDYIEEDDQTTFATEIDRAGHMIASSPKLYFPRIYGNATFYGSSAHGHVADFKIPVFASQIVLDGRDLASRLAAIEAQLGGGDDPGGITYDYDISIGGSFEISYDGSSPAIYAPDILDWYDDGGTIAFTGVSAGTGTIYINGAEYSVRVQ